MKKVRLNHLIVAGSVVAFSAGLYSFLWAISGIELAFVDCNGTYRLHASNFRCERPVLLIYAFWFFIALAAALAFWAWTRSRNSGDKN